MQSEKLAADHRALEAARQCEELRIELSRARGRLDEKQADLDEVCRMLKNVQEDYERLAQVQRRPSLGGGGADARADAAMSGSASVGVASVGADAVEGGGKEARDGRGRQSEVSATPAPFCLFLGLSALLRSLVSHCALLNRVHLCLCAAQDAANLLREEREARRRAERTTARSSLTRRAMQIALTMRCTRVCGAGTWAKTESALRSSYAVLEARFKAVLQAQVESGFKTDLAQGLDAAAGLRGSAGATPAAVAAAVAAAAIGSPRSSVSAVQSPSSRLQSPSGRGGGGSGYAGSVGGGSGVESIALPPGMSHSSRRDPSLRVKPRSQQQPAPQQQGSFYSSADGYPHELSSSASETASPRARAKRGASQQRGGGSGNRRSVSRRRGRASLRPSKPAQASAWSEAEELALQQCSVALFGRHSACMYPQTAQQ